MNITRWKPDTCDCVIDYEWDASVPDVSRVHVYKDGTLCDIHKNIGITKANHFNVILEENKRKNQAIELAVKQIPGLVDKVSFSLDPVTRVVKIKFSNTISAGQRNGLTNAFTAKFGDGKVVVE